MTQMKRCECGKTTLTLNSVVEMHATLQTRQCLHHHGSKQEMHEKDILKIKQFDKKNTHLTLMPFKKRRVILSELGELCTSLL